MLKVIIQSASLPTFPGLKFRFTPTDIEPENVNPGSMLLHDDLGDAWIGYLVAGEHDEVILLSAWKAVNDKYREEHP